MTARIRKWAELADCGWESLILGNGASIALHSGFQYSALLHEAIQQPGVGPKVKALFERLGTTDFERVLGRLRNAKEVLDALSADAREVTRAYDNVRSALVNAVHEVHPAYGKVQRDLPTFGQFLRLFRKVVSLNYDVLVYWALLRVNDDTPLAVKDGFVPDPTDPDRGALRFPEGDWKWLLRDHAGVKNPTLIVYPHGALILAAERDGRHRKIVTAEALRETGGPTGLLSTITQAWADEGVVPLFVSEGDSVQKRAAIRRNDYLSLVYAQILPSLGESVVIYGWSMRDQDAHLVERIFAPRARRQHVDRVAVSVHVAGHSRADLETRCAEVKARLRARNHALRVEFFDAASPGAWCKPSTAPSP